MSNLEPPGAGLPEFERSWLSGLLRVASAFMSDQRIQRMFRNEAQTILQIVDDVDYDLASQTVLIPRYQGMEDSSRQWSLFMVLDHLCRVDRHLASLIEALSQGLPAAGEIDIAAFKPDESAGAEMLEEFAQVANQYLKTVESLKPLRNTPRFPHPWFGPLDAHGWHCLAAFHHRIHRKQARKIVAMIGQP